MAQTTIIPDTDPAYTSDSPYPLSPRDFCDGRTADLQAFFDDLDNPNVDQGELAERANELQITRAEFEAHRAKQEAKTAEAVASF